LSLNSTDKKAERLLTDFILKKYSICGDIHFDNENWTSEKTKPGDGKYNLFSVTVHDL